jgi:ABC-type bacteriocin/lantibiotic exporter with double-glycine peptidase domain
MKSRKGLLGQFFFMLLLPVWGTQAATEGLWLDVPYIHQEKDGCGSASVAMVMQYWLGKRAGVSTERSEAARIQKELYSPKAHGIYASAIENYLRSSGFEVFAFRGEWKDLREQVEKGRPLIVSLKPGRGSDLHYVVVAGVAPEDSAVVLNDPARSKLLRLDRGEFLKEWRGADNWTLLAVPKQSR